MCDASVLMDPEELSLIDPADVKYGFDEVEQRNCCLAPVGFGGDWEGPALRCVD